MKCSKIIRLENVTIFFYSYWSFYGQSFYVENSGHLSILNDVNIVNIFDHDKVVFTHKHNTLYYMLRVLTSVLNSTIGSKKKYQSHSRFVHEYDKWIVFFATSKEKESSDKIVFGTDWKETYWYAMESNVHNKRYVMKN